MSHFLRRGGIKKVPRSAILSGTARVPKDLMRCVTQVTAMHEILRLRLRMTVLGELIMSRLGELIMSRLGNESLGQSQ